MNGIRVTLAKLRAAEPNRWPGYADWIVDQARQRGGAVAAEFIVLPAELHGRLAAEAATRPHGAIQPSPAGPWSPLHSAVGRLSPGPAASATIDRFVASIPFTTTNRRGQFAAHRLVCRNPRRGRRPTCASGPATYRTP